jgi:hypothetical protein
MIIVIYFEQRNNCWSKAAVLIMDKKISRFKVKFIERFRSIRFIHNNKTKTKNNHSHSWIFSVRLAEKFQNKSKVCNNNVYSDM